MGVAVMENQICIKEMIRGKNPAMAGRIPPPVYRFLEKIAHVDKINSYLQKASGLPPREALSFALDFLSLNWKIKTAGVSAAPLILEDIFPRESRITVCANHPFGGADALVLLDLFVQKYGNAQIPANDLVQTVRPLGSYFVPVNKHGSNRESFRNFEEVFTKDVPLIFFPAGRTGRPANGGIAHKVIEDAPWSKTFLKKSRTHRRLLLPVHITGRNSRLFYVTAWIRKKLKISLNLEMLLLVDELMKKRGKTIEIIMGKPIDPRLLGPELDDNRWTQMLQRFVQDMGSGRENDFFAWSAKRRKEDENHEMG